MSTFYEQVGGEKFFADLVSQFYAVVATDPILRPMYPDTDMKGAAQRLQWFLEQHPSYLFLGTWDAKSDQLQQLRRTVKQDLQRIFLRLLVHKKCS